MIKLPEAELLNFLPSLFKNDTDMICLSYALKKAIERLLTHERSVMIYNFIDELPGRVLDALACDLHVDWYDFSYSIDIKRAVIKNSIKIYQKMGTKYAVETALRDAYKGADVSEWFEYGGKPYHFKIDVDISREGLSENTGSEIIDKVNFYKNLRSHCDGIYYHLSANPANVSAAAGQSAGATLKVKAKLADSVSAGTKIQMMSSSKIGAGIKIKACLAESVKGATADNAKALAGAVLIGEIRIKAALAESVHGQAAGAAVHAGVMSVDRLKIKAETEKELKAAFELKEFGYQRMENRLMIRKEQ